MTIQVLSHCFKDGVLHVSLIETRLFRRPRIVGVIARDRTWHMTGWRVWVFDNGEPVWQGKYRQHCYVLEQYLVELELNGTIKQVPKL